MTLDTLVMLLGGFVAILPFLGLPNSWDRVLFLLAGIIIIAVGIIVRRRRGFEESALREQQTRSYIETPRMPEPASHEVQ